LEIHSLLLLLSTTSGMNRLFSIMLYTRKARSALRYADAGVANGKVTQAGQVSAEQPDTERTELPRGAHTEVKTWSSRLGLEHKANNFILGK
jgi:hypothetical protein